MIDYTEQLQLIIEGILYQNGKLDLIQVNLMEIRELLLTLVILAISTLVWVVIYKIWIIFTS